MIHMIHTIHVRVWPPFLAFKSMFTSGLRPAAAACLPAFRCDICWCQFHGFATLGFHWGYGGFHRHGGTPSSMDRWMVYGKYRIPSINGWELGVPLFQETLYKWGYHGICMTYAWEYHGQTWLAGKSTMYFDVFPPAIELHLVWGFSCHVWRFS